MRCEGSKIILATKSYYGLIVLEKGFANDHKRKHYQTVMCQFPKAGYTLSERTSNEQWTRTLFCSLLLFRWYTPKQMRMECSARFPYEAVHQRKFVHDAHTCRSLDSLPFTVSCCSLFHHIYNIIIYRTFISQFYFLSI